jgi:hypothetical protein
MEDMIDCVYVAAAAHDARFTRICIASIRYFYPNIPINILAGGSLDSKLTEELASYWDVTLADLTTGDYGWGFVKLEPLFQQTRQRFLVLDSDTILAGPVLDWAKQPEDFIVDDERDELYSMKRVKELYYDHERAQADGNCVAKPAFVFNTGQWIGSSGILSREDFKGIVEWGLPPRVCRPNVFKMGEQGAFNFVINEQWRAGKIRVARIPLMRWPGHGMAGLNVDVVKARTAAPIVVHWAGQKEKRLRDMIGADLLSFFERMYYRRLPLGRTRRLNVAFQGYARPKLGRLKLVAKTAFRKVLRGAAS